MARILVLSDSLGLPRDEPQEVLYEQTWPSLLAQSGHTVLQSSLGGATSFDLMRQAVYLKMFLPDVVVLQVGIVDCAPRALSYHENIIYNYWWLTRKILGRLMMYFGPRIRNWRNIAYVKPENFCENLQKIRSSLSQSRIYAVGILPASDQYEQALPRIQQRVAQYNGLLHELFGAGYIDMNSMPAEGIMSDFHHPNAIGHSFLFEKIKEAIE